MPQHHYRQQGSINDHLHHIHSPTGGDLLSDIFNPIAGFFGVLPMLAIKGIRAATGGELESKKVKRKKVKKGSQIQGAGFDFMRDLFNPVIGVAKKVVGTVENVVSTVEDIIPI